MKQAKQKIRRFRRKLKGIWTIEVVQDLESYHGLDLEDELSAILQEEIQNEFDFMERNPDYKKVVELASKSIQLAIDAEIINKILESNKHETH